MFESCIYTFGHRRYNRTSSALASFAKVNRVIHGWKSDFPEWLVKLASMILGKLVNCKNVVSILSNIYTSIVSG